MIADPTTLAADPLANVQKDQEDPSLENDYSSGEYRNRMAEFIKSKEEPVVPSTEQSNGDAAKAAEAKAAEESRKAEADKVAADAKAKVVPGKKGSDGLTKEERSELLTYKTKAEQYEGRVKELEAKVASGEATFKEINELKSKNVELEKRFGEKDKELQDWLSKQDPIALEAIKASELYQREVSQPTLEIEQQLAELCKSYEVNSEDLLRAHYTKDRVERNKQIADLKSGMDDETKSDISEALRKLSALDQKHAQIQARPQEALTSIKEAEATKARLTKERETTAYQRAGDNVWKHLIEEEFPLVKENPDAANRVREKAKGIDWTNMPPDKRAYLAHGAFLALEYRDALKEMETKLNQRIAELEASNKKLGGKPSISTGHSETRIQKDAPSTVTVDDNMSTAEAFKQSPFYKGLK